MSHLVTGGGVAIAESGILVSEASHLLQVYHQDGDKPKPLIGEGLNKPAEVYLLGIHKMDKATGRPSKDPIALAKFSQRLKSTAASQGTRFVDYKPENGLWRFQVDHFSK
jgi:hypothetical protein